MRGLCISTISWSLLPHPAELGSGSTGSTGKPRVDQVGIGLRLWNDPTPSQQPTQVTMATCCHFQSFLFSTGSQNSYPAPEVVC